MHRTTPPPFVERSLLKIGHERDTTLIDDVAAVACSTPTHAAEAAVPLDCGAARRELVRVAAALRRVGRGIAPGPASGGAGGGRRGRAAARAWRAQPEDPRDPRRRRTRSGRALRLPAPDRHRRPRPRPPPRGREGDGVCRRLRRRRGASAERAATRALERRREALRRATVTLRAHDPERTLERGYALAETADSTPVTTADAAVAAGAVRLRFADGRVKAEIEGDIEREAR